MITEIDKVINPIMKKTYGGRSYRVFIKIEYKDKKLSITGVEGPLNSGNCLGSAGQINMTLNDDIKNNVGWKYLDNWSETEMLKLLRSWKHWHLNNMKAGTPDQEEEITRFRIENNITGWAYEEEVAFLKRINLYEDNGHKYGTAWLMEEVPQDVLLFLISLPDTKVKPAWV